MKIEEKQDILLQPERIQLTRSGFLLVDPVIGRYKIPYKKIMAARIGIKDQKTGIYSEPELADISRDMRGDLILYDLQQRIWRIKTDLVEQPAGAILVELAVRASYIFLGGDTVCPDLKDEEIFEEIAYMAEKIQ